MNRDPNDSPASLHALYDDMVKFVESCFSEEEREDLRVVIRLTIEFRAALDSGSSITRYTCESIFSGVEFFASLVHAYARLVGAEMKTQLNCDVVSVPSLSQTFLSIYPQLVADGPFERRCRILLDLFKIEIVIAALTYDCCTQ